MVVPDLTSMKVIVTGANGLIGRRVVRKLSEYGATPVCLVGPSTATRPDLPGEYVTRDLLSEPDLASVMEGADYVVHLAARSGGTEFQSAAHTDIFRDNCHMTQAVLDAALRSGAKRLFLASSAVVYRPHRAGPISERTPVLRADEDSISGYAWSKITDELLGHWASEGSRLGVVIGRFTNVYGPEGALNQEPTTVVHALTRRAFQAAAGGQLTVWGDGTAVRSFVHADDAATSVITVLAHGSSGGAYNIDSGEPVTIADLATIVRNQVDPALEIRFDPSRGGGPYHRVLDISRLLGLGFGPEYSLHKGISDLVSKCRDQM